MIYRMGTYAQRFAGETTLIPGDGTTAWTDIVGAVTTSLGKIIPNSTVVGWDKGASFGTLPTSTDGYVEFDLALMVGQTDGFIVCGFGTSTNSGTLSNMNHTLYFANTTNGVRPYELGSQLGTFISYNFSDVFKIERIGTTVYYKKNGTTFYTSLSASTGALYFNISSNRHMGVENLKIVY